MKIVPFLVLALLGALAWHAAGAEDFYRGKQIRLVVGSDAGGGYDAYARLVAKHWPDFIPGNPTFVVQNMPGAASLKSVQFLDVGAPADGTTIVTFNPGLITQSLTTPDKVPVKFLNYAWIGNISEDVRVCFTWHATGIKTFADMLKAEKIVYGNTGIGTSAYTDDRMLAEIFGVKVRMVQGYPGSADKRIAIERGEIDGDCGGITSLPSDWLPAGKLAVFMRLSPMPQPGLDPAVPFGGALLGNDIDRRAYDFLVTPQRLGRLFIASGRTPPGRLAALREAFGRMMADPEFLADAGKLNLGLVPARGDQVESEIAAIYATPGDILARAKAVVGE